MSVCTRDGDRDGDGDETETETETERQRSKDRAIAPQFPFLPGRSTSIHTAVRSSFAVNIYDQNLRDRIIGCSQLHLNYADRKPYIQVSVRLLRIKDKWAMSG